MGFGLGVMDLRFRAIVLGFRLRVLGFEVIG